MSQDGVLSSEERRAALLMFLPQKSCEEVFFKIPAMQEVADHALSEADGPMVGQERALRPCTHVG